MLNVSTTFDLQKDVVSYICKKEAAFGRMKDSLGALDPQIINIERDGGVLYSWNGATGTTQIGKYDPATKHNKLLYTFDKQVCVSSCSLNKEETLLAVSLAQRTRAEERLKPVSKCLSLLIEIQPINNTKVLKAVDCKIRVQFLYPDTASSSALESHLLLLANEGYVEQYHVMLIKQEGYRVVMCNFERMAKDRVVEDFLWIQWDSQGQRLFYLTHRDRAVLVCLQFYPNRNCETVFELALDLPSNPFSTLRFINLGFDHYQEEEEEEEELGQDDPISMAVFTNATESSMCVCYSQQVTAQQASYTIVLVHKGCSKTFTVALDGDMSLHTGDLHPLFIPLGYYILVYLPGHFLHCINSRQQELLCHSLFLSGPESDLGLTAEGAVVSCLPDSTSLLDLAAGRMFSLDISSDFLLQLLQAPRPSRPDHQRLAVMHCMLVYLGPNPALEQRIIEWICDNIMPFQSFDQIQEFVLASLYRIVYNKSVSLDKVLPYTSVFGEKEQQASLDEVPGVRCSTQLHAEPLFSKKHSWSLPGFWEDLQWSSERAQYFEAVPSPRFRTQQLQQRRSSPAPGPGRKPGCQAPEAASSAQPPQKKTEKKRASGSHIEENAKKVLSVVDTWCRDKKLVPLFQEEDHEQRVLIGLMVDELREHLNRHLPLLGKKKIDSLVVNYVAKLLELIRYMLESVWLKYKLGSCVMCLNTPGSPAEWTVFHVMCRILEATKSLCLPLPPGYHTLLAVLGVRCLPRHMFLQYVDQRLLQLTETFVSRLMTDLDNSPSNEQLKFSILKRLPEPMEQRICHLWDHPVSSACISRAYVTNLLKKQANTKGSQFIDRGRPGFTPDFLPLTYLTKTLSDLEDEALNPFEEQENVDARFVEETALKQTLILLGFEVK